MSCITGYGETYIEKFENSFWVTNLMRMIKDKYLRVGSHNQALTQF